MTAASFWAGRGMEKPTKLPDGKVLSEFDFEGLISYSYGVYMLWNVVETEPFNSKMNLTRNSAPASTPS